MKFSVDAIQIAKVAVEITDLKAENAKMRDLMEDLSLLVIKEDPDAPYAQSLIDRADELLREIDA